MMYTYGCFIAGGNQGTWDCFLIFVGVIIAFIFLAKQIRILFIMKRCKDRCLGKIVSIDTHTKYHRIEKIYVYYAKVKYEYKGIEYNSFSQFGMIEPFSFNENDEIDIFCNPKRPDEFVDEKSREYGYEVHMHVLKLIFSILFISLAVYGLFFVFAK